MFELFPAQPEVFEHVRVVWGAAGAKCETPNRLGSTARANSVAEATLRGLASNVSNFTLDGLHTFRPSNFSSLKLNSAYHLVLSLRHYVQ